MFEGLIERAQRSIDALASKYVTRVAVAVPFFIAVGFGTAAAAVWLSREYGSVTAYMILGATFAAIGLAGAAAIAVSASSAPVIDDTQSDEAVTDQKATGASPKFDAETMLAALGAAGPVAMPMVLRLLSRNLPLVLAVVIVAFLLFSRSHDSDAEQPATAA